jgi:hypothetical protein
MPGNAPMEIQFPHSEDKLLFKFELRAKKLTEVLGSYLECSA